MRVGERSSVRPSGTVPTQRGPANKKRAAPGPEVRVPGLAKTLVQASMKAISS